MKIQIQDACVRMLVDIREAHHVTPFNSFFSLPHILLSIFKLFSHFLTLSDSDNNMILLNQ